MPERESSGAIDETAARWAARLDRGDLSPEEKQALDRWTEGDPRRLGALARAMAVSARFDPPCAPHGAQGNRFREPSRRD
jgi:transmembrane sensor